MKKSKASATKAEPAVLEFPDWSGMDDHASRIRPEAAFELCEQYAAQFFDVRRNREGKRPEICDVEFTL